MSLRPTTAVLDFRRYIGAQILTHYTLCLDHSHKLRKEYHIQLLNKNRVFETGKKCPGCGYKLR